ncbi:Integrin-like protein [Candidatus Koribacter versatilis Ellin345]|uniref:Integrin-like protein n=1 Tax=Koribacter versatilis (strain Ellin345) TaxID=204669 RepID=Q1IJD2_KORVE|nr:MBG domain-containing protein [Candidatus Koribacter versatilis]ABF43018.1 Integrin-like protein [Candidatus Koribacter versatilis Ellin345]
MFAQSFSVRFSSSRLALRLSGLLCSCFLSASVWAAKTPTTTTLGIAPGTSVSERTILTFSATVTAGGSPVSSGQVKFCDMENATFCEEGSLLAKVWVTRTGTATLRIPLAYGSHKIQAVFQGTSTYGVSASSAQRVDVASGAVSTATRIISSQSYGYGGLYQAQVAVTGAPIPPMSGSLSMLDTTNANYNLVSISFTDSTIGFTPLASVGGTAIGQPQFTAVGDFNGDGKLDFVVVSNLANKAQVFLGDGLGSFTQGATLAADSPNAVIAADLNGDGKLDIAILNLETIAIYLGNGDGTFRLKSSPSTGDWGYGFTIGDFNDDGIPDFAVTENYLNVVQLLLGNGDGTFRLGASFPSGNNPEDIVTADFNHDGAMDLAFVNQMDYTASVLLGDGTGNFTLGSTISLSDSPYTLVVGDFNNDGIPDLGISALVQGASIFLGAGDGSFTQVSTVSCGSSANGYGMAVADFNADGKTDLVVGGTLFLGDGTGNFSVFHYVGGNGSAVSIGDFNGDGGPDLITPVYSSNSPYSGNVYLSLEQGSVSLLVAPIRVLGAGTHNVMASYSGDALNAASHSSIVAMTGAQINTTLLLNAFPEKSANLGDTVQFLATLSPQTVGAYLPTGIVTFSDGATVLGTSPLVQGLATLSTTTLTTGSHSIKAAFAGNSNFKASTSPIMVVTVAGTITPVITWATPVPITYGTPLSATQLNASTTVPGTFVYTPAAGTVLASGAQTLSVTFNPTDTTTYNPASATVQLTVNKATITVTANNATRPYGGANPSFTASYAGFVNGDTVSVLIGAPSLASSATATSPVGSYVITASLGTLAATNYSFTFVNGSLSVTQRALTITANNQSKTYGQTLTLGTTAFTSSELQNGETIGGVTLTSAGAATGASVAGSPYSITPSAATGGTFTTSNYSITYVNASLTVNKATPTVSIWPAAGAITYGQSLASSVLSGGTASVGGTFGFTTPGYIPPVAGTNAQSVTFTPADAVDYNLVSATVNVLVNKAPLTVSATATKYYGDANPTLTPTYTAFVNGDTSAALSGSPNLATTVTQTTTPGTYTITVTVGTLSSTNYSFTYVNGSFTVAKAPLAITANDRTKTAGTTLTMGTTLFTATGLKLGQTVGAVTLTSTGSGASATVAGSPYAIVPSNARTGTFNINNYAVNYVNGSLAVTQATSTTTLTSDTPDPSRAGSPFTVGFSVTPATLVPTGTVTIVMDDPAATTCTGTLNATGTGTCVMTPPVGTPNLVYTMTGTYSGDSNYLPSAPSAGRTHHVN